MELGKGLVDAYVVVNEAYSSREDSTSDFPERTIGQDYIELAFQTARDTDPHAVLIYNDFGNESLKTDTWSGHNSDKYHRIVAGLKAKDSSTLSACRCT